MKRSTVPIDSIKPHPRNYRRHPSAQVDAIRQSLDAFGQYRDVVVSSDGVILAGHGVWLARKAQGAKTIGEVRMDFPHTDPRAEKLMVADNELTKGADDDEAQLAALLADIQRTEGLDGTGWDDGALDALIGEMAKQQPYSPNLQPELADKQYTDGDIDKEQQRLAGQYQKEKDLDEITCPHCGGEFFIDK